MPGNLPMIALSSDLVAMMLAAIGLVGLVLLMMIWRHLRAWQQSVRVYERERRAMEEFRRHLAGTPYLTASQEQ